MGEGPTDPPRQSFWLRNRFIQGFAFTTAQHPLLARNDAGAGPPLIIRNPAARALLAQFPQAPQGRHKKRPGVSQVRCGCFSGMGLLPLG